MLGGNLLCFARRTAHNAKAWKNVTKSVTITVTSHLFSPESEKTIELMFKTVRTLARGFHLQIL